MEKGFYSSSSRINASIDRDVGLWLTSKLEEPWSSEKITAQISQELLSAIKPKFSSLEPNIKIGLLFSFLALRRKQITELETPIKDIIQIGIEDEDEWVKTVSRLLYSLLEKQPTTESNNNQTNLKQNHFSDSQFVETRDALLKTISALDRPIQFLPLEFKYLSANLLPNPLPQAHTDNLHFKLKTKVPHPSQPVISNLGASLITAPKEPSTPKKAFYEDQYSSPSTTPTLPPHSPPHMATITSASPPIPRAGRQGISTSSNAMPTLQNASNNNVSTPNTPTLTSTPSHATSTVPSVSSSAPRGNYLAQKKKMMVLDLSEVQALSQQQGKKKKDVLPGQVETPTADSAEKDKKEKKKRKKKESEEAEQASDSDKEKKKRKKKDKEDAESEEKKAKKKGKKEKEEKGATSPLTTLTPAALNPAKSTLLNLGLPLNIPTTVGQNGQNASAMLSQALFNQPGTAVANKIQPITSSMTIPGQSTGPTTARPPAAIPPPKQAAVAPKLSAANPSAETLFEQSNVLSAEHKKVILAFLAGNRVNPYPHLGNVVQFLLHQEDKVTPDSNQTPYMEQLIFEINYETGTWRKLRRKRMSQPTAPTPTDASSVASLVVPEPQ